MIWYALLNTMWIMYVSCFKTETLLIRAFDFKERFVKECFATLKLAKDHKIYPTKEYFAVSMRTLIFVREKYLFNIF